MWSGAVATRAGSLDRRAATEESRLTRRIEEVRMCRLFDRRSRRAKGWPAWGVVCLFACVGALGASPAIASTIGLLPDPDSDGTFVDYQAAPGEANQFFGLGVQAQGR